RCPCARRARSPSYTQQPRASRPDVHRRHAPRPRPLGVRAHGPTLPTLRHRDPRDGARRRHTRTPRVLVPELPGVARLTLAPIRARHYGGRMTRTDRASLLVHVDRAAAFAALTEADALATWLPPADMRGRFDSFEMRTGGAYRLVLTYDDASGSPGKTTADEDVSNVRIREIVPGERVVQEIEFEATDPNLQ